MKLMHSQQIETRPMETIVYLDTCLRRYIYLVNLPMICRTDALLSRGREGDLNTHRRDAPRPNRNREPCTSFTPIASVLAVSLEN